MDGYIEQINRERIAERTRLNMSAKNLLESYSSWLSIDSADLCPGHYGNPRLKGQSCFCSVREASVWACYVSGPSQVVLSSMYTEDCQSYGMTAA
jgi:hypothetical protein